MKRLLITSDFGKKFSMTYFNNINLANVLRLSCRVALFVPIYKAIFSRSWFNNSPRFCLILFILFPVFGRILICLVFNDLFSLIPVNIKSPATFWNLTFCYFCGCYMINFTGSNFCTVFIADMLYNENLVIADAICSKSPPPFFKICHIYPTMMKLGTVIPYLKEIQKNI